MRAYLDRYAGPAVFLASFAVYLLTAAPEVTFWDSGELVFGAATLGIPHPPAYPVFCILGKALSLLPFGNAAYRLNLLSALFGSLTVFVVYRLSREMCGTMPAATPAAAAAALLLAFSNQLWSQSVVAEVYTVNSFLLASLAYFLFRYSAGGRETYLHASAFVLGLAGAAHQSVVFIIPAYTAYYLYAGKVRANPARLVVSAFFGMLGYSAILYIPVRAAAWPPINVGAPFFVSRLKWVLKISEHIGTLEYVPHRLAALAGGEAALAAAAALLLCAAAWFLRRKPYILFLIITAASYYAGMQLLTAGDRDVLRWGLQVKFYIPVLLFAAPVAAMLMAGIFSTRGPADTKAARSSAVALAAWLLIALPFSALYWNYRTNDNSRNFFAFDFGSNTLKSVMYKGVLFAWGDNGIFPVWYLQGYERYRDDVLFIHTELMSYDWFTARMRWTIKRRYGFTYKPPSRTTNLKLNVPILKFELEKRTPVYFDYSAASMLGIGLDKLQPQGLVHLVKSWKPAGLDAVWGRYVMRGALDDSTNKAFAAEGILQIYGFEAGIWTQQAYEAKRLPEALTAYGIARGLGYGDKLMDEWAEGVRKELKERKNK